MGELCYIFRLPGKAVGKRAKGIWRGPCVCIGYQGDNTWVALGGRTMLVAPEHIRRVAPEDVSYPGGRDDITVALEQLAQAREHLQRHDQVFEDQRVQPEQPPVERQELDQQWTENPPRERDPNDPDEHLFEPLLDDDLLRKSREQHESREQRESREQHESREQRESREQGESREQDESRPREGSRQLEGNV